MFTECSLNVHQVPWVLEWARQWAVLTVRALATLALVLPSVSAPAALVHLALHAATMLTTGAVLPHLVRMLIIIR
jgi:hypothetical protein